MVVFLRPLGLRLGGMFAVGPAAGLIHDVESCKEIIDSIMAEAEEGLKRLNSLGL